jgi:hypothetical protein
VSSQVSGAAVDLAAVNGEASDSSGVEHGAELIAFTEAVMSGDRVAAAQARAALRKVLPPAGCVQVAATIAAFNVVDRIADSIGIPLDEMMVAMSGDVRESLNLARFASAANTRA